MSVLAKPKTYPIPAEVEQALNNRLSVAYAELCTKGKLFTGIKRPKGFRQMKPKNCFCNAQLVAMQGRATYVEGLCVSRCVPQFAFAHGWLTLDGEHAIDVTLPDAMEHAYFGIPFDDRHALNRALLASGYRADLLDINSIAILIPFPPQLAQAVQS
jgi:hypothetical protein